MAGWCDVEKVVDYTVDGIKIWLGSMKVSRAWKEGVMVRSVHRSSVFGSDLAVKRYCLRRYSCALSANAPTE